MSREQLLELEATLRDGPLDLGGDVEEQRAIFAEMMAATPVPDDVTTSTATLGGIPVVQIQTPGVTAGNVIFYLHGGAYAIGSAGSSVGLASELTRRTASRAVSVEYRLAPEHPYPAGLDDAVAAYAALVDDDPAARIVIAGESAGGGLAAATLLALRDAWLPLPRAGFLMSPWADLTLSGASLTAKAAVDAALTPEGLRRRAGDYVAAGDPADGLISAVFGDLAGLPPILIQAGSHEILLDDATRLAARAAAADVAVTLDVTPGAPHVFQGFAGMLDEADAALDRAAAFLRRQLDDRASG